MLRPSLPATIILAALGLSACVGVTEIEPFREVSCIGAARVSLSDAVQAAEVEGGKAIDAAYRQTQEMGCLRGNPGYYDVTVLVEGRLSFVSIDADSRQVQPRLEQDMFDSLGAQALELAAEGSSSSRVPIARRTAVTLFQAIGIAEEQGGRALEARADMKNGRVGYMVKLVDRGGRLRSAWVDGERAT